MKRDLTFIIRVLEREARSCFLINIPLSKNYFYLPNCSKKILLTKLVYVSYDLLEFNNRKINKILKLIIFTNNR